MCLLTRRGSRQPAHAMRAGVRAWTTGQAEPAAAWSPAVCSKQQTVVLCARRRAPGVLRAGTCGLGWLARTRGDGVAPAETSALNTTRPARRRCGRRARRRRSAAAGAGEGGYSDEAAVTCGTGSRGQSAGVGFLGNASKPVCCPCLGRAIRAKRVRSHACTHARARAHARPASVHCAHATVCQVGARTRGQLGGRVGAVDCDSPRMPRVCFRLVYVLKR